MTYTRNSPWAIVVNAIESAKTYALVLLAFLVTRPDLSGLLGDLVPVAFWAYTCATVYSIFARWAFRLFSFDSEGIRHRHGVLSRVEVFLPWSSVAAIEVHSNPVLGATGCRKVVVRASAGLDGEITFDAVRHDLVDEIGRVSGLPVSQTSEHRAEPTPTSDPSASTPTDPAPGESVAVEPIFSASQRDLVVMSLAYGRFALFAPFIMGSYFEYAPMAGLPGPEELIARGLPEGPAILLALFGGFVVGSIAYGYAVTLLRFWRFRASVTGGSLLLEGGLLASQKRTIPLDGVMGLVLRRNIFDLLTGRGRLAILSRDANQVLGKNVVFPALKLREIAARADAIHGDATELLALDRARVRAGRAWWIAGTQVALTVSAALLVLGAFGLWQYYAVAAAVVLFVCLVFVNRCFTVVRRDESGRGILYRRGVMWRSSYAIPLAAVHVLRCDTHPWDRWIGLERMSLYYFSGSARKLFAWRPPGGCAGDRWLESRCSASLHHND